MGADNTASRRLLDLLDHPWVEAHVAGYFAEGANGRPLFTGSRFETLEKARPAPFRFTPADLVAVTTLGVYVPAATAIWILEDGADDLGTYLEEIPADLSPEGEAGQHQLRDRNSALSRLWHKLEGEHGVGWVTAGKLCARKRPTLVPIYDAHVRAAVGDPPRWWDMVAEAFLDQSLVDALDRLRALRGVPSHISRVRVLDIALWMRQHGHQWLLQ